MLTAEPRTWTGAPHPAVLAAWTPAPVVPGLAFPAVRGAMLRAHLLPPEAVLVAGPVHCQAAVAAGSWNTAPLEEPAVAAAPAPPWAPVAPAEAASARALAHRLFGTLSAVGQAGVRQAGGQAGFRQAAQVPCAEPSRFSRSTPVLIPTLRGTRPRHWRLHLQATPKSGGRRRAWAAPPPSRLPGLPSTSDVPLSLASPLWSLLLSSLPTDSQQLAQPCRTAPCQK
mmetsp:Transcript_54470/g.145409  ORF Transcript_54470/g.145409 Transcript_54470/m.145409 type:complete len:226 (-) Transcript_54470:1489-2166(-)